MLIKRFLLFFLLTLSVHNYGMDLSEATHDCEKKIQEYHNNIVKERYKEAFSIFSKENIDNTSQTIIESLFQKRKVISVEFVKVINASGKIYDSLSIIHTKNKPLISRFVYNKKEKNCFFYDMEVGDILREFVVSYDFFVAPDEELKEKVEIAKEEIKKIFLAHKKKHSYFYFHSELVLGKSIIKIGLVNSPLTKEGKTLFFDIYFYMDNENNVNYLTMRKSSYESIL